MKTGRRKYQYVAGKPHIYISNFTGKWVCRCIKTGLHGSGMKPRSAYNDYLRHMKWVNAGRPTRKPKGIK